MDSDDRFGRILADIKSELGWGPQNCEGAARANFHCEYCHKDLLESLDNYYSWQIDHITPGGGEDLDNIALACAVCNHLKLAYRPEGATRTEKIANAWSVIEPRRKAKEGELAKLRAIVGPR